MEVVVGWQGEVIQVICETLGVVRENLVEEDCDEDNHNKEDKYNKEDNYNKDNEIQDEQIRILNDQNEYRNWRKRIFS